MPMGTSPPHTGISKFSRGTAARLAMSMVTTNSDGSITVFPYPQGNQKQELPYTVISDGRILRENLRLLGRDEGWVRKKLHGKGLTPERVLLMTVTPSGQCAVFPRE